MNAANKIIPEVGENRRHEHMDQLDQLRIYDSAGLPLIGAAQSRGGGLE